jgi:hypothetical protein
MSMFVVGFFLTLLHSSRMYLFPLVNLYIVRHNFCSILVHRGCTFMHFLCGRVYISCNFYILGISWLYVIYKEDVFF